MATKAKAGTVFARAYRLEQTVGGGLAPLWTARELRSGERFAVKMIPPALLRSPDAPSALSAMVAKFESLRDPGVVLTNAVVADGEEVAVIREWIDGKSLAQAHAAQPAHHFEVREIKDLVFALAGTMESVHAARLVHGDLKPPNIFIDVGGALRITDFGSGSWQTAEMLAAGGRLASAASTPYLSPAQARGQAPLPADDVYAFGVIVYELLTGRPPFFTGKFRRKIASRIPPPMMDRRREFGLIGEAIPLSWEQAIAACLARDAYARPLGFGAVLKMLGQADTKTTTTSVLNEESPPAQTSAGRMPATSDDRLAAQPPPVEAAVAASAPDKTSNAEAPVEERAHERVEPEPVPVAGMETRFEWAPAAASTVAVTAESRPPQAVRAPAERSSARAPESPTPTAAARPSPQTVPPPKKFPAAAAKAPAAPGGEPPGARGSPTLAAEFLTRSDPQEAPISALDPGWARASEREVGSYSHRSERRGGRGPHLGWDVVFLRGLITLVMLAVAATGGWYAWQLVQTQQTLERIETRLASLPPEPSDAQIAAIDKQFTTLSPTWLAQRQRLARDQWNRRKAAIAEHRAAAQQGGIVVNTTPAGAQVQIADRAAQRAPVELRDIPPGEYPLTVLLDGYAPQQQTIEVKSGETTPVDVKLERLTGALRLESNPAGAAFEIIDVSGKEPAQRGKAPAELRLPIGKYRVAFTRDGFPPDEKSIEISANTAATATGVFSEGVLAITQLGDASATVVVDDVERGKSPMRLTLPVGEHNVRLQFADGRLDEQRVMIQRDSTRIVSAEAPTPPPPPASEPLPAETPMVATEQSVPGQPSISPPSMASELAKHASENSAATPEPEEQPGAKEEKTAEPTIAQREPEPPASPPAPAEPVKQPEPEPSRVANAPVSRPPPSMQPGPPEAAAPPPATNVPVPNPSKPRATPSGAATDPKVDYSRVFELREVSTRPVLLEREVPKLSERLQRAINGGRVELSLILDRDGSPALITVQSATDERLKDPSIAAARLWRFSPARKDGRPVSVRVVVPIVFPQVRR